MIKEIFFKVWQKIIFREIVSPRPSFSEGEDLYRFIDKEDSPLQKAQKICNLMTQEEKMSLIGGFQWFAVRPIPRLGLNAMWMADASSGVRGVGQSTVFPCMVSMTATWNRELIHKAAAILAEECRAKGISCLLGPGVNIARVPTCGRNFEYMGEDPYLAAEGACAYIDGLQKNGIVATVKHYAVNNSEYDRNKVGSDLDERTLREIYLPAFEAAVKKAGVLSVMSSYNPINGVSASENRRLLTDILKNEWGFEGFVVSDWLSCYDAEKPFNAGLDLEMPNAMYMNKKNLTRLLEKGRITETDLDDKVTRILSSFFAVGAYERSAVDSAAKENGPEHLQIACETAAEGVVLLKNENNTLPLDFSQQPMTVLITGSRAKNFETGGGGSSRVASHQKVSPIDALREQVGDRGKIVYSSSPTAAAFKKADAVVVCTGFSYGIEGEFHDRPWRLPKKDRKLILKAAAHNPQTVVVLNSGGAVETEEWSSKTAAIVDAFFPGDASGRVVADVLLGNVNPSGKLPFTFAKKWSDYSSVENYVKVPEKFGLLRALGPAGMRFLRRLKKPFVYEEGIFVGYRHFETVGIEPAFAFGHGLSYTTFTITDVKISSVKMEKGETLEISATVTNTGTRAGAETVQLYLADEEASLPRPAKELKGFEKVFLNPGESKTVCLSITEESLRFYHSSNRGWCAEPGNFTAFVGNSSVSTAASVSFEYLG